MKEQRFNLGRPRRYESVEIDGRWFVMDHKDPLTGRLLDLAGSKEAVLQTVYAFNRLGGTWRARRLT